MFPTIQSLHVYPIKSLAGVNLSSAKITSRGFEYDRRMMLVNADKHHVTQRDFPEMALLDIEIIEGVLNVKHRLTGDKMKISLESSFNRKYEEVMIWKDRVLAHRGHSEINSWFSDILQGHVELVFMPDDIKRSVQNHEDAIVGFPDSNQYLMIGQSSFDHLNSQLTDPILMNRFRPNIVFSKLTPYQEDNWRRIRIGDHNFEVTKQCARCNLTLVNQETAEVGEEPIRTLSKYRLIDRKILFGVYLKSVGGHTDKITIGDLINFEGVTFAG